MVNRTQPLKILVCDDVARRGRIASESIRRGIDDHVDIQECFATELIDKLAKFYKHSVERNLKNEIVKDSVFDNFDIIVIDNNLSELRMGGLRLTADVVIGHIRAFSSCKIIVSLNARLDCDFDLLNLSQNSGGKADIDLNTEHLRLKWLWSRTDAEGEEFQPWYWLKLLDAPARRENQMSQLTDLNKKILEFFKFATVAVSELSRRATAELHPRRKNLAIAKVSFLDCFRHSRISLIEEERKTLIRNKNWEAIRRIVCFEIETWLHRYVLGPQTVLVDVPHMLQRIPVILGDEMRMIDRWTEASRSDNPPYLHEKRFLRHQWLSVPAFWWGELRNEEELNKKLSAVDIDEIPDAVFCEDVSRFEERSVNRPLKFVAGFHSKWDQRFISKVNRIKYLPADRLVR